MFKKLKQKINEEQSPQRSAQSPQQAQTGSGDRRSSQTPPFHQDCAPPSDREKYNYMILIERPLKGRPISGEQTIFQHVYE